MIALFANNFLLPHITTVFQNKKTRKKIMYKRDWIINIFTNGTS